MSFKFIVEPENPELAAKYSRAYEFHVRPMVGETITALDAFFRITKIIHFSGPAEKSFGVLVVVPDEEYSIQSSPLTSGPNP